MKKRSVSPWNLRRNGVNVHPLVVRRGRALGYTFVNNDLGKMCHIFMPQFRIVNTAKKKRREPNHKTHCSIIRASAERLQRERCNTHSRFNPLARAML